jgi:uncharacterized BrkB/YihY/UPF0761 family membrane protein
MPEDIPATGWKEIFWRSWNELSDNNIFLAAGGVTYAVLVALVPTLAALVSLYGLVANFSSYDKTYGSLGGVVVLLTWLYITSFVVLLGAVINAQAERQTHEDTTAVRRAL